MESTYDSNGKETTWIVSYYQDGAWAYNTKEEYKMINETQKILGRTIPITATTVRIPIENCHSESINVEFENPFDLNELIDLLKNSPGIVVQDDNYNNVYPMPITANGHDEVFVGRIRRDFSRKNSLNFWVVSDNIRKGAATNAVQILEKLVEKDVTNEYR